MNRRDFTKTLAAICCIPGVKLQDRYITNCTVTDSFDLEPVFGIDKVEFYDFNQQHTTYLKIDYSDGTTERYSSTKKTWHDDASTRGTGMYMIPQSACIKDNNFVLQFNGCVMICHDIRRI